MLGKDDIIDVIEPVIDELAAFFCVSRLAAKIRMVDAGYEEAIGAFIYVDGRYVTPHKFKKNAIQRKIRHLPLVRKKLQFRVLLIEI